MRFYAPRSKVKTFSSHFWQRRDAANKKIEKYARKHGYKVVSVQYRGYGSRRATAVFSR